MSYSHALDGALAPRFQRELERFAKPWYRPRGLRIFRDSTNLSATPELWSSIERALASAEWFVLMASPEAARSPWVDREVRWWLDNRAVQRLLLVLTSGELRWDDAAGGFDRTWTTAVPPALLGALREEPRWVDLRWLRDSEQVDRSNPRLRDNVADVAATVRGIPKDELIGEHIRQHRRAMRLTRSAIAALVVLLIGAVLASVIAVSQRNEAINQARVARSRQLAALTLANLSTHLDLAQLLAVQAYRTDPNPQTKAALFEAVTASPHLVRYMPVGTEIKMVVGAADGSVVVAGTADGRLIRWDLTRGTSSTLNIGHAPITDIATDAKGTRIVVSDGTQAVLWDESNGRHTVLGTGKSGVVAVSPSGKLLAVFWPALDDPYNKAGELTLYDGASGNQVKRAPLDPATDKLGLLDDHTLMEGSIEGPWRRRSVPDLALLASSDTFLSGADAGTPNYSANGAYFGADTFGDVRVYDIGASAGNSNWDHPARSIVIGGGAEEAFAVSSDGSRLAGASGGLITVATFGPDGKPTLDQLPGNDSVTGLAFIGGQRLISIHGATLGLWDLGSPGRFGLDLGVEHPTYCRACEPHLAISNDGTRAVSTGDQVVEYRLDGPTDPTPLTNGSADLNLDNNTVPLWSTDGTRVVLLGVNGGAGLVWNPDKPSQPITTWPPAFGDHEPAAARVSTDGQHVAEITSHGDIIMRRFSDGTVERSFPGRYDLNTIGFPPPPVAVSISDDLSTAALIDQRGVTLVDLVTGNQHQLTDLPANGVLFTHDHLLVLLRDNGLQTWNTAGTQLLATAPTIRLGLIAPPQGTLVAGIRSDSVLVVNDIETSEPLGSFPISTDPGTAAATAFTADGTRLVIGSYGHHVTRWDMTEQGWIRTACATAGRDLTPEEWQRYVGTPTPSNLSCG